MLVFYKGKAGDIELHADAKKDTLWATLDQIAKVFGRDKSVISRHLKNIFSTHELLKSSVVAKNATTAADGKTYTVDYYNLDAILSVGYRVNSKKATQFRIWATNILKEYLLRGFKINATDLIDSTEKFEELNKTIELLKDESRGTRLKAKVSLRMSKNIL
ncbi:MAG: virulence RhuM family protein [Patescibacteria group bacterium]|nr:virulence RhuM family protein [Patescibacteria group bacterium]